MTAEVLQGDGLERPETKLHIGDEDAATRWLKRPNRALGGRVPLELIDTEPGARAVENVLGRIAYGGVS